MTKVTSVAGVTEKALGLSKQPIALLIILITIQSSKKPMAIPETVSNF